MNDIGSWLEDHGLGKYTNVFVENDVDLRALPELSDEDLKELGLSLGHRRVLLRAVREEAENAVEVFHQQPAESQPATPQSAQAERRQLTVMFADLVGSTKLSRELDPEELRKLNRAYQDAAKAAVEQFDGYVARYMGDGVLAYFGYPIAHEDDPERAILAGLELVSRVRAIDGSRPLSVRVGIATGPVVVGDLIGDGASQESAVVGETPNLAARLQGKANSDAILISESTMRVVSGAFAVEVLPTAVLDGFSEPVSIYRVHRALDAPSRFSATRARKLSPLIGRNDELGMLKRRWEQVCGGELRAVFVSGDPGVGKSRLVEELFLSIPSLEANVIRCQCSPHQRNTPFYPVARHLERACAFRDDDSPEARREKLRKLIVDSRGEPDWVPYFAALLSLPSGELDDLGPQRRREVTLEALTGTVARWASDAPRVLLVEDAHWADASTLEMLERLTDEARDSRLLVLVTHRPELELSWASQGTNTVLRLSRLGRQETHELLNGILQSRQIAQSLVQEITSRSDGVPLYVEELAKCASEQLAESIPVTLYDALLARLDRLGAAKDVAQTAACIGREFTAELLSHVSALAEDQLTAALEELTQAEVIYPVHRHGRASYVFKHALLRDAAYESLLLETRERLHDVIAKGIESLYQQDPHWYAQIGHHYSGAMQPILAADYFTKAGDAALAAFSLPEALALYQQGIDAQSLTDSAVEIDLRLKRAAVYISSSDFGSAWDEGRQAAEAAARAGHILLEGEATARMAQASLFQAEVDRCEAECRRAIELGARVPDGDRVAANAWTWRSLNLAVQGELEAVKAGVSTALEHCHAAKDQTSEAIILATSSIVRNWQGDYSEAIATSREAVNVARAANAQFALVTACFMGTLPLIGCGRYDDALGMLNEGIPLGEKLGEEFQYTRMVNTMGWLLAEVGSVERAIAYNERSDEIARRRRNPEATSNCKLNIADVLLATGDAAAALDLCEEVDGIVHHPSTAEWMKWRYSTHLFSGYGEALLSLGDLPGAEEKCRQGLVLAEASTSKKYLARIWRLRAQIAGRQADFSNAQHAIGRALEYAQRIESPTQIWKTHFAHGEILRAQGGADARGAFEAAEQTLATMRENLIAPELQQEFDNSPVFRRVRDVIVEAS